MNGKAMANTFPLSITVIIGPLIIDTPNKARNFNELIECFNLMWKTGKRRQQTVKNKYAIKDALPD
jgi:hypothetical protein